ncbi:Nramp family divalent metal transporter [Deinococcus deserti]|uniref:Putative NRAMP family Mn2+/Fe2+ transporter n=1 Tax=Deinococcus deserti (strain DSM 17065 / CIP 109153 / LMG 22923 / VCD115) TaxID=546414 RepID=C1D3V9_DEIDV|nr:Nramp family divalent metal transporter [Deinococcus deserti]ACO48188.2 putative NRAMP family Mn2+/Fe2+ transporter [Deinococcus deserti VCD115]
MNDRAHGQPDSEHSRVPEAPQGRERLKWLGPSFLWMMSAAGSGELLFTPRIAAQYGYTLLWALLIAVAFKWFINREVGRYAVCTGGNVLRGFANLPGPRHWALWFILVPQIVVAVATVAGLAGTAGTAGALFTSGGAAAWSIGIVLLAGTVIVLGQYKLVERVITWLAVLITLAVLVTAISVTPDLGALAGGLAPQLPAGVDFAEVVPWLGFMLAGAAGLVWFSYWVQARGYGAAYAAEEVDPHSLSDTERSRLRGWLAFLTLSNTLAVVGALIIAVAFLILGTELLRPEGLVPDESEVARTLGRLLGDVWGPAGFWFMVTAVVVTFSSTILSAQDGFARMFSGGVRTLLTGFGVRASEVNRTWMRRGVVVGLLVALPIGAYLLFGEPVALLQLAGAIEAAHIPVVALLTLLLNRRALPQELQPSGLALAATALAAVFFAAFAAYYMYQVATAG